MDKTEKKKIKTVINVGWDNINDTVMKGFTGFAAKGYMLTKMDEKLFTFEKSDPADLDFILYSGGENGCAPYIEKGYKIVCSYDGHFILSIPRELSDDIVKKRKKTVCALIMAVSALLMCAVLLMPHDARWLSAVRSVLSAVLSCVFVYGAVNLLRK